MINRMRRWKVVTRANSLRRMTITTHRLVFQVPSRSQIALRILGEISRYLDRVKQKFSGIKSHDCHVLRM
jgi:hypothetical protein